MNKRHALLPALLLALTLAACGGGGSGDEDQIEETIQTAATSTDPATCTELSTQAFVEQNSDESGRAAVESCEKEAKDPSNNAKSVTVTKIEVDGSDATADATFVGSGFDGQTLTVALVKDGDQWKLDETTGFAKLDKAALGKTFEEQFEATEELTPQQTECIVGKIEAGSQAQIEELLLGGSSAPLVELAETCA